MLRLSELKCHYQTPRGVVQAVDGVSFEIHPNEVLGIAGESGCGKSTLLKVLYDYIQPPLQIVSGSYEADFPDGNGKVKTIGPGEIRRALVGIHLVYSAGLNECAQSSDTHRESVL